MNTYVILCTDKPQSLPLRLATREAHFAYLREAAVTVRVGGPFLDAQGAMVGSMLIVDAPDIEAAETFARNDPYRKAGLFSDVIVRPWKATVGALG